MGDSYKELTDDAKRHYESFSAVKEQTERPQWYDAIGMAEDATKELNLWNYWQGIGNDSPKLMIVGQDWGHINPESPCVKNIRAIASNPSTDRQYLSGCTDGQLDFQTDRALIDIFRKHLDRNLDEVRYDDLYFTNLFLGYRQDKSSGGYFKQSWLTQDAKLFFKRLVDIKQPEVIVCLGRATSETAYRALTGSKLAMPNGFYDYISSPENGSALPGFENVRFYAMAHPGGMGAANRKSAKGGSCSILDDWSFLKDCLG